MSAAPEDDLGAEREIDLRPRAVLESARATSLGGVEDAIDASPYVAIALLGLFAAELLLRAAAGRRREHGEQLPAPSAR